jgi:dynein intermediate chain 3, axonemal
MVEQMNSVVPKPWKTTTEEVTNKEIEDTYMRPTRTPMKLQFSLKRKMFGQEFNI